ncbi:MAG: sigma-70 family RNA polymerase sigma factor [Bacteroidetes bacterium]|nr:MAG: sigma-70 family RNA polymerase sigma factor [Bacteroidota bacterium]
MHSAAETVIEERDLIVRAASGDTRAFEALYRRNVGRVYAVCLRIVTDVPRAEDVTQEVFVQAWEKIGSFRGESLFSTWLHRIAVNLSLTSLRSRQRYESRVETNEEIETFDSPAERHSPETVIDLEDAIRRLPPSARAIFVLHDIEGYRHEEIAEQLEVVVGTSKAQLHRARRMLRKVLEL